jgi:hypothetical protein
MPYLPLPHVVIMPYPPLPHVVIMPYRCIDLNTTAMGKLNAVRADACRMAVSVTGRQIEIKQELKQLEGKFMGPNKDYVNHKEKHNIVTA